GTPRRRRSWVHRSYAGAHFFRRAEAGIRDRTVTGVQSCALPSSTFDGYLDSLARRIDRAGLAGLAPLLAWLRERRPADDPLAVCHGDFHPQNVLVEHGAATGVLDWPNALLADPVFDVASTLGILRFVPVDLVSTSRPLRWLARVGQPLLAARYLAGYRRRRAIPVERLGYYQVAAGLRQLV